jgi:hypothetical protein
MSQEQGVLTKDFAVSAPAGTAAAAAGDGAPGVGASSAVDPSSKGNGDSRPVAASGGLVFREPAYRKAKEGSADDDTAAATSGSVQSAALGGEVQAAERESGVKSPTET